MTEAANEYEEPDLVAYTLRLVAAEVPGLSAHVVAKIEKRVKAEFGGRRHYLPKGAKRLAAAERVAVFEDGLRNLPDQAITEKHQISRATLYRVMKNSGGRFSGG